jgi:hypothetical protein
MACRFATLRDFANKLEPVRSGEEGNRTPPLLVIARSYWRELRVASHGHEQGHLLNCAKSPRPAAPEL